MINTPGFSDKISDFTQSGVETFQRCFPQNPGKFCTLINTPLDIPAQIEAMATTNTISSPGAGSPNLLLYSLDNGSIQLPLNSPPNANFTGTVNGYSVDFINTSTDDGTIVNHNWDFGDGNLIDTNNTTITHTYSVNGTYIVQLTVTDDDSATGTMERNFRVKVTGKDGSGSDDKCSTGQEKRGLCSR